MLLGKQVFSEELRLQELFEEMSSLGLMWVDTGSQWSFTIFTINLSILIFKYMILRCSSDPPAFPGLRELGNISGGAKGILEAQKDQTDQQEGVNKSPLHTSSSNKRVKVKGRLIFCFCVI